MTAQTRRPTLVPPAPKAPDEVEIAKRRMRNLRKFGVTVRPAITFRSGPQPMTDEERAAGTRAGQRVLGLTLLANKPPTAMG